MQHYIDVVQDRSGNVIGGAIVIITDNSTGLPVTVYSDAGGSIVQPTVTTDVNGTFSFYAPSGRYNFVVIKNGVTLKTVNDVDIPGDYPTAMALVDAQAGTNATAQSISASVLHNSFLLSNGSAVIGTTNGGTGSVTRTVASKLNDTISVKDFGAVGDGLTDDTAALALIDAATVGNISFPSGIYKVDSNLTINTPISFAQGAILKPSSGVTITLGSPFNASISQIFDLSLGGIIALPRGSSEVWAEWWGTLGNGYLGVGTGAKLDNDVTIQQAIDAVYATVQGVYGGRVNIDRGDFYVSAQINIPNQVSIIGHGSSYPAIFANPTGWSAGSTMFYSSNGTSSMFNSRIENLRIMANNVANITYVVRSVAWQEKCGLRNVLITDFKGYGFHYSIGYGGAASLYLRDCEIWAGVGASACVYVDMSTFTVGFLQLELTACTFTGASSQQASFFGVRVLGRVIANLNQIHFENMQSGVYLQDATCLTGQSITASGNANITQLIQCSSSWTGTIDASNVKKCAAPSFILDANRPYPIANIQPYDDCVVWPPNANRPFASATLVAGAAPVLTYSQNIASVTYVGTGIYRLDFTTNAYGTQYYNILCSSHDSTVIQICGVVQTAAYFYVYTRNNLGAATNASGFNVRVFHRP